MTPIRLLRTAVLGFGLATLAGCGAVSTLNSAAGPLDTYQLIAAPGTGTVSRSSRTLLIAPPTSDGSVNTDRILIKPNALQVQYLPGAAWVDPAPIHIQNLLTRSIANSGGVAFVGSDAAGPLPDYVLLTDITHFQGEVGANGAPDAVVVRLVLTLVRDDDRHIVASRVFERRVETNAHNAITLVSAFNVATSEVLREATAWTVRAMGGRVGS